MTATATMATPASADAPADLLPWDSEFFGHRIARARSRTLTPGGVEALMDWCRCQQLGCLYFVADAADAATIRLAEQYDFRHVDIRVTLECALSPASGVELDPDGPIRHVRPGDVPAIKAIARTAFGLTRYHFDGRFARERADELYAVWIEKSCAGGADAVFVSEVGGRAVGFVTCHHGPDGTGQIGLAGLDATARGHGLGRSLVSAALGWLARQGATRARVVTQGRNIGALRLYERSGFVVDTVELFYHRWFTHEAQA